LAENDSLSTHSDILFVIDANDPENDAYEYDVQRRVPSVEKTKRVLGFECTTSLDEMLDEVIPWIEMAIAEGRI
jgi:nucleoside-diphosphate-sugar epimerase